MRLKTVGPRSHRAFLIVEATEPVSTLDESPLNLTVQLNLQKRGCIELHYPSVNSTFVSTASPSGLVQTRPPGPSSRAKSPSISTCNACARFQLLSCPLHHHGVWGAIEHLWMEALDGQRQAHSLPNNFYCIAVAANFCRVNMLIPGPPGAARQFCDRFDLRSLLKHISEVVPPFAHFNFSMTLHSSDRIDCTTDNSTFFSAQV